MLKIWEPIEDAPLDGYELFERRIMPVRDTASHLFAMLGYVDTDEAQRILQRALAVCSLSGVPIPAHFRRLYVHSEEGIREDYLLTDLACYLITINADTNHPAVARAQVYFLNKR